LFSLVFLRGGNATRVWARITRDLAAPFDPAVVEWRPQGKTSPGARVQAIAYLSSAAIRDRLDATVGAGGWSFAWEPLVVDGGELRVAKGALTVHGVTNEDVGTSSNFEASKGAVTDSLKRTASLWGIGRYLRSLPVIWIVLDARGQIGEATLAKLAEGLRRRASEAA
jgi:hypothetical protein